MPRSYTLEFKAEAVKLVTEQGYSGAKAAQLLGISPKNVTRWVQDAAGKQSTTHAPLTSEQEEIRQLRKENERLRMEREILKKAAAFFANEKI
jgi:transposase